MQKRPFKKQTIEMYTGCLKIKSKSPEVVLKPHLIASPSTNSRMSPTNFITNSPTMKHKKLKEKTGLNLLSKYTTGTEPKKDKGCIDLFAMNKEEPKKDSKETAVTGSGPARSEERRVGKEC